MERARYAVRGARCAVAPVLLDPRRTSASHRQQPRTAHGAPDSYVSFPIGSFLTLFPVATKIALHTAGAIGGVPGSPTPPCESVLGTMCTSTTGISARRSIR